MSIIVYGNKLRSQMKKRHARFEHRYGIHMSERQLASAKKQARRGRGWGWKRNALGAFVFKPKKAEN